MFESIRFLLLIAAAVVAQTPPTFDQYMTCSNGCSANNSGPGSMWVADNPPVCEFACCPGRLQVMSASGCLEIVPYNAIHCENNVWCADGVTPYDATAQPLQVACVDADYGFDLDYSYPDMTCPTSGQANYDGINAYTGDATTPLCGTTTSTPVTTTTSAASTASTAATTASTPASTTITVTTTASTPASTTTVATTTASTLASTTATGTTTASTSETTASTTPAAITTMASTTTESSTTSTTIGSTPSTTTDDGTTTTFSSTSSAGTTMLSTTTSDTATSSSAATTVADTTTGAGTSAAASGTAEYYLCSPFVAFDGATYDNRCAQYDSGAVCSGDPSTAFCTCSAGNTGETCGNTIAQLQTIAPLSGPTNNSDALVAMMIEAKNNGSNIFNANLPSILTFLTDSQRATMSYSPEDMIVDATFEGKHLDINTAFASFNDPALGNCFTFNYWNSSFTYVARSIGKKAGLFVRLNAMPEEYLPFIDTMGIDVYIAEIGTGIYVESNKMISRPGGQDTFMLTRTTTSLLKDWMSTCADGIAAAQSFYFTGNYSVDGCYRSCYQDAVYEACGCMDPMFGRRNGVAACTFDLMPCILLLSEKRGDPVSWPECHCPEPCNSQDYDIAASRVGFTTKTNCQLSGMQYNTSKCNPSQSFVRIGFLTLESLVQVEQEVYPLSRVFGNIGNVGGLLIGFSMVCLFETLFFLVTMGCIATGHDQHAPTAGTGRHD